MLTVNTASNTYDLTVRKTVKAELKITTGAYDELIDEWIHQASELVAKECSRVFAKETVTETLYCVFKSVVCLQRYPVLSVASLVADDVALVENTDFSVDADSGRLWRLSGSSRTRWGTGKLVVQYVGGYDLLGTLPRPLERAALDLVKLAYFSATRDPSVRSVEIPGVMSKTYFTGDLSSIGSLPPSVVTNIEPFKRHDAFADD